MTKFNRYYLILTFIYLSLSSSANALKNDSSFIIDLKVNVGEKVNAFTISGDEKKGSLIYMAENQKEERALEKEDMTFLLKKVKSLSKLKSDKGPCSREFQEITLKMNKDSFSKRSCLQSGSKLANELRRILDLLTFKI